MPVHLPPEITDLIIDHHLHGDKETLKKFSLVSKSWVIRARRYLFNEVTLSNPSQLKRWKGTSSDPVKSPAYHTNSLRVMNAKIVTAADAEWIREFFTNVTELYLWVDHYLVPDPSAFDKLLPALKSLSLHFSKIKFTSLYTLICSFPYLKDLALCGRIIERDGATFRPSTWPVFTGTLTLRCSPKDTKNLLLNLPNSLHFQKIVWWVDLYNGEDVVGWMTVLVGMCSNTLEHIVIENYAGQCESTAPC
jgi:hypothetical protein